MTAKELNHAQLAELKARYFAEKEDRDISYDEIININEFVSDEEIFEEFADVKFTEDDFMCYHIEVQEYDGKWEVVNTKDNNNVVMSFNKEEIDSKIDNHYVKYFQLKEILTDCVYNAWETSSILLMKTLLIWIQYAVKSGLKIS